MAKKSRLETPRSVDPTPEPTVDPIPEPEPTVDPTPELEPTVDPTPESAPKVETVPASEFDEHFLIMFPDDWPKHRRWGVEHFTLFRDGVGVLNMDAICGHKPAWFKVDEKGNRVKAVAFSIHSYADGFRKQGAKVERIPADKAKALRIEIGKDKETQLRAQGFDELADKLHDNDAPAQNDAEAEVAAHTKAAEEVHKDDPGMVVGEPKKPAEQAPHEKLEG